MSTGELLEAWRDATRAAELAERLAASALKRAENAERNATAAEEIARLAEEVAASAERAALAARTAATEARSIATDIEHGDLASADDAAVTTRAEEMAARDRYHDAERDAFERHSGGSNVPG